MELSVSQLIGLVSVAALIVLALGFLWYISARTSYIYRSSLRTAVTWGIAVLVLQTVFLLAISSGG